MGSKTIREIIIEKYGDGETISVIAKSLKMLRSSLSRIVNRWKKLGTTEKKPSPGRPRNIRNKQLVKVVRNRVLRNSKVNCRKMARELQKSRMTIHRVLRNDLGLKAYKLQIRQKLTEPNKQNRLVKCKAILSRIMQTRGRPILFSDEKIFSVSQNFNKQNDRIYAISIEDACKKGRFVGKRQSDESVMVWLGICKDGTTDPIFIPQGAKMNAKKYLDLVLEKGVLPFAQAHFNNRDWCFQQDSAPAHRAKVVQDWCRINFPDFIATADWPSYSPDLNPLDFGVWGVVQSAVNSTQHNSLASLKASIIQAVDNLSLEFLRATCEAFETRLKLCIKSKGGYIE